MLMNLLLLLMKYTKQYNYICHKIMCYSQDYTVLERIFKLSKQTG